MKRFLIFGWLVLGTLTSATAQADRYATQMRKLLAEMDTVRGSKSTQELAYRFLRVATAEQSKWLPYYYASLCFVTAAYEEKDVTKIDALCDVAQQYVERADSLSAPKVESLCLKSMIPLARISVDVMKRGAANLIESKQLLQEAVALDNRNPRAFFLLGQQLANMPTAFGGGKQKALPYFQKASQLFADKVAQEATLDVHWGRESNANMLALCQK
ncbi:hypothetical protein [Spirosoma validum]|uniref:Tetratricopeptide repeat protein n=1 Tax=Spirosoma validum TaxID=2771355 RepID=A0A927GDR0_9BACT|nr:hypothetical protein [Spirosoma validum]MBD2754057.1 hypothetical protein [Spirosoma validum]